MNWRTILGIIITYGSIKEMYNIVKDHYAGITVEPLYPFVLLIVATFVFLGFYLIYKGRSKKN